MYVRMYMHRCKKCVVSKYSSYHPNAMLHTGACVCSLACVGRHTVPLCVAKCTRVPGIVHVYVNKSTCLSTCIV